MMYSPYSGTYCNPKDESGIITPCKVDGVNFEYDNAEGAMYGLRGGYSNNYYLILNSPAAKYEYLYATDTTIRVYNEARLYHFYHWGMPYLRDSRSNGSLEDMQKDHPFISDPLKVSTIGASIEGAFSYTVPQSAVLKEHRSRMAFSIRCGSAVRSAKIKRISISGLRKKAWYQPIKKTFYFDPENEVARGEYEDIVIYENLTGLEIERTVTDRGVTVGKSWSITGPSSAEVLTSGTKANEYFTYILSDDHISRDADNTYYLKEPPYLNIVLSGDGDTEVHLTPIPLALDYEFQTNYYWLITISKIWLAAEVTTDWWEFMNIAQEDQDIEIDNYTDGYHKVVHEIGDWTAMLNEGDASIEPGGGDPIPGTGSGNPENWHDEENEGDSNVDAGSGGLVPGSGSGSAGDWDNGHQGAGAGNGEIDGDGNAGVDVGAGTGTGEWNDAQNDGNGSVDAGTVIETGVAVSIEAGKLYTLRVNTPGKVYRFTCTDPDNVLYINMSDGPNYTSVLNGGQTPVLTTREYTIYVKSADTVAFSKVN